MIKVKGKTSELLNYYGSDFSGFYYSWKTGKIGLTYLDGVGAFQGEMTEAYLQSRGYKNFIA